MCNQGEMLLWKEGVIVLPHIFCLWEGVELGEEGFLPPYLLDAAPFAKGWSSEDGAPLESQDRSFWSCLRDRMPSSCLQLTLCG